MRRKILCYGEPHTGPNKRADTGADADAYRKPYICTHPGPDTSTDTGCLRSGGRLHRVRLMLPQVHLTVLGLCD